MFSSYSDYVVYVDESGDHGLITVDEQYPIFVLSFCVFNKKTYTEKVVPELMKLKFKVFGHDMVILHEHSIRKRKGPFSQLNKEAREIFLQDLTNLVSICDFILIAVVIDKIELKNQSNPLYHPYHLAMGLGLDRLYCLMKELNQSDALTHIIFEARGNPEDRELHEEFNRVRSGDNMLQKPFPFELIIVDKKINSEGLQLADLTARPIGISQLKPNQPNRAMEILWDKLYRDPAGNVIGHGLNTLPKSFSLKSEKPQSLL